MHNTYISSTTYSLWSKGPLSFSFNDYSYLLNERFDRTPLRSSSCCGCCACCACSSHRLPSTPSLYGLRQSTLLHWPGSRRLILGGGDRFYCRLPVYGLGQGEYEVCCSLKESSVCNRSRRKRNGRRRCTHSEDDSEISHSGRFDDAEAVLSLLCDEVGLEHFGGGNRTGSSFDRVEVEKRGSFRDRERQVSSSNRVEVAKGVTIGGRERNVSSSKREEVGKGRKIGGRKRNVSSSKQVELERRESYGIECHSANKKSDGLGSQESNPRPGSEPITLESREEDCRHNEETGTFSSTENHRRRKGGSSSSYHSFSSLGDFESDVEVEEKEEQFKEESSSGYRYLGKTGEEDRYDGVVEEDYVRHKKDEAKGRVVTSEWSNTVPRIGADWDWRKKSEKKLTETSVEETKSWIESSQRHSQVSRTNVSGCGKSSTSHEKIENVEANSESMINVDEGRRKQYGQAENQYIGPSESRRKDQQLTESPDLPASDARPATFGRRSPVREGNFGVAANLVYETRDERLKTVNVLAGVDDLKTNSEMTEIQDINTEGTSNQHRQSDTRMKNPEGNTNLVLSTVQQSNEQHHPTDRWIGEQIVSGRRFHQVAETSESHESSSAKASIVQSGNRMENKKKNTDLVSSPQAKGLYHRTNLEASQRIQSTKRSKDATDISVLHASKTARDETASDKRINRINTSTSLAKPVEETGERLNQNDKMVMQIRSMNEGQRPTKVSTFYEGGSEEASSFQASLNLVSQHRVQVDAEEDKRSSKAIVVPPPSQLVSRGSTHVEMTSVYPTPEFLGETSESGSVAHYTCSGGRTPALHLETYSGAGSSETYEEPLNLITPEDALGSAERFQKSSTQYVAEFVEKARHEALTSEIQNVKKDSELTLITGEKYRQETSSEFVSSDSQLKEHDLRLSSGDSGTKGPSEEKWHVTEACIKQAQAEGPKDNAETGNAIAKRSGRSLWSVIADVIRLRWVSHAESPNSVVRSGERSSSNKSARSETWFSGHEESSDENAKREKGNMPAEVMSSDYQLHLKVLGQSQGETSDIMRSKDEISHLEADRSFSLSLSESKVISVASGEESLGFSDTKGSRDTCSGMEIMGLPSPSKSLRRSSIVEESSRIGETVASGSGSMEQVGELNSARLTEISGIDGKGGELKQRKLQRKKQVLRDRFDEWEDAYKLESEQRRIDEMFMREALLEAKKAADSWEVPVGAVLVHHGKIIARGCNLVEELRDSTAHAEMICIREASNLLRTWRLSEMTLYVTLEPCPMCAGAILQARINTLVWGAPNKLLGADGSWIRLFPDGGDGNGSAMADKPAAPVHPFHPNMTIRRGVLASECADAMQQFFQLRRRKTEKKEEAAPKPASLRRSHHPLNILTKIHNPFHLFCL